VRDENYKYPICRELTRVNADGEWCRVEIEIRFPRHTDYQPVLSICGSYGHVCSEEVVDAYTLRSLEDYFSERNPDMTEEELKRHANEAASYGDTGGVEVVGDAPEGSPVQGLLVVEGCGQVREEISKFFPEVVPYFRWHLNDMRKGPNGESWGYEPLPADVIAWAENFGEG
jgi:hypothetical protein